MVTVYVLQSEVDQGFYVGMTKDLERRLSQHNAGRVPSTRQRTPLSLLFTETFATYAEARQREKYLKTGIGRSYIKQHAGIV